MYDFIVVGAGYGGISTAALLANESKNILLLESHSKIGGCASYYKRKGFLFDVGATTLSGIQPNQPLGRLFNLLNIQPNLLKIDPGVIIKSDEKIIKRVADKDSWINNACSVFNSENQKEFWKEVFETEKKAWEFINHNSSLPPRSFGDVIRLLKPSNIEYLSLLPKIYKSVENVINKYDLQDELFIKFLEEQLLITTQNNIKDSPFLTACLGLAYPSETYYPFGGMYKPADLIMEVYKQKGGELKINRRVISITKKKDYFLVKTNKGEEFKTKNVVSNIPIWNMVSITEGKISNYFQRQSNLFDRSWGAFTINFGIEFSSQLDSLYFQIHTKDKIPNCSSRSFFVSFSHINDSEKAPSGWRSVTISAHTDTNLWNNLSEEEYSNRKKITTEFILSEFDRNFPEMRNSEKLFVLSGSPNTFEHYTNRHKGFVGGIPHSIKKSLLRMPPNLTPFKGLYIVGDTVFPGQGTPAVVLGALNIVTRILN